MNQFTYGKAFGGWAFLFAIACMATVSQATHIPSALDVAGFRRGMLNEGYLAHTVNPSVGRFGEEWTGWVDIRHPSLAGANDTNLGYDRSDRRIDVRSNVLTDGAGIVATPNRTQDFNYANQAYLLQSGVSVIETSVRNITSGAAGAPAFTFPLSHGLGAAQAGQPAEEQAIMGLNAGAPTVESYYAGSNAGGNSLFSGAFAETYNPSLNGGAGNEAIFMANVPVPRTDTFSHEMYHFAGDGLAVQSQNVGDASHSTDPLNLIASGGIRSIPVNTGQVGPVMSGTVGGRDQLSSAQVNRIFNNAGAAPWLQTSDNGGAAGDRVDWDFVVDHDQFGNDHDSNVGTANVNFGVEDTAADNHSGGTESMFWGIQPTIASGQAGKNKTGLGTFAATPDYGGAWFRYADVFSLGLRYSDSDVNGAGGLSQRESALDYNLFFQLQSGAVVPGVATKVFVGGWTGNSSADDYLTRWLSPDKATGVYVFSLSTPGHDGVAQIDALIVSEMVPEPGTVLLLAIGSLMLVVSKRRRICPLAV